MKKCRMEVEVFNRMVAAVKDAADKADIREPLNYIRLEVYNDLHKIKAVACNGFIMATEWSDTIAQHDHNENFVFYVKPDMPKMPKHAGDVYVTLDEAGNGQIVARVECADSRVEINQPKKEYIKYEHFITDAKPATRVCLDVKYIMTLLKGIQAGSSGKQVVLELQGDCRHPVLVRACGNPESVRLIMPMTMKSN